MPSSDLFLHDPYIMPQKEKAVWLFGKLNDLTQLHRMNCPEYARLLQLFYTRSEQFEDIIDIPYIPVSLFKTKKLLSIPQTEIFKILHSSGTTSSQPSQIILDMATAQRQTMALVHIMTSILGSKRLPMLIIDHAHVIQDRHSYSARGAAIVGMLTFGRDICYALDDDMTLNFSRLTTWLNRHKGEPILIFGLTFIVWQCLLSQIEPNHIAIPQGIFFHTGGWKKLEEVAVNNVLFKKTLYDKTKIQRCHNFYGMVEQVGSVFVECEQGYLHCPQFAEIIIRDPKTWQACDRMKTGVIQVLSALPTSYPGHSLLTEDLGMIKGIDDCACGRKGKYFISLGRVPQAEVRGCSDTYRAK